jgi:hypothetical protein
MKKKWYKSKVLWFNAVVAGLAALETAVPLLSEVLPGNVYAWLATTLAVGNAMLRVISSQTPLQFRRHVEDADN